MKAHFANLAEINQQRTQTGKLYREFLRVPSMSAGLYVLPAGATDPQRPHREDEMYYVVRGRGHFRAGDDDREVSAGSVYAALERLEAKALVTSSLGESTPERGGRAKRYFRATEDGLRTAHETRRVLSGLWKKLPAAGGDLA